MLIDEIVTTPEAHDWSGYTTWHDLVERAEPDPDIALNFVSPTAFSFGQKEWGKKAVVLPQPALVFGNLLRTWNALAPDELHIEADELMPCVEEHVVVSRIDRLKTSVLKFKHSLQIGFVGEVTYKCMAERERARRQVNTLADFAFYAGVGMKTTMGMGQVCRG